MFVMPKLRSVAILVFASSILSAQESAPKAKEAVLPESRPAEAARYTKIGDLPGVQAVTKFSDRLYRGAQPQGAKGMESLKNLGVTVILSVEEADKEENEAAQQAGIKVINVPTEYNGLPAEVIESLVSPYRTLEETVYVHCHHGKHRGGAAAAILRMTFEGIPQNETVQELAELGASKRYPGLYETVRKYRPDPAKAHRVLRPRPGIDGLIEVTPWVLRGTSAISDEAVNALKDLGVRTILSADMSAEAQERARAAGLTVVMAPVTPDRTESREREAVVRALAEKKNEKVFIHATDDPVKVALMVALFRLKMSEWTPDEAAREAEALLASDAGAKLAGILRATP